MPHIGLRTPRDWRRARRILVGLGAAGLGLALLAEPLAGIALFGSALVGLVLVESAQIRRSIMENQRQQQALTHIRPLAGELPLDFTGWAADPVMVHNAIRLLLEARPRLVLECGSGSSTVIIARCLRALGGGHIVSLDHDPTYARRTSELLRLHGVEDLATVVAAPLVNREIGGRLVRWYGPQYEPLLTQPIDVLLVDGPPGSSGPRARYPAGMMLKNHLAPECWILLDDGDRPDERAIAHAWSGELSATLSYLDGGRGGWLLHRRAAADSRPQDA
ncbi:MAG: class I SAM-dependent methyltransferase [Gemmatimonadales bacterium]